LWRAVDGDGDAASPYRTHIRGSSHPAGPTLEGGCVSTLDAGRDAVGDVPPIEPWDWWWTAGEAERDLASSLPIERLLPIAKASAGTLGADVDALRIGFDIAPRRGRPPVPVAYTEFGARPHGQSSGEPWVF